MRSHVVSSAHVGASIPEPFRSRGHSGMMTIHVHYEGTFAGASTTNGIKLYVKQYRGAGVFLRDLSLGITDTRQTVCGSFERTLMGASGVGEDIVPATDILKSTEKTLDRTRLICYLCKQRCPLCHNSNAGIVPTSSCDTHSRVPDLPPSSTAPPLAVLFLSFAALQR
jgi:hypothetical protein